MTFDASRTVRELATEIPDATRVFEHFGIDYCCGGSQPLEIACQRAKIPVEEVVRSLEGSRSARATREAAPDFQSMSPTDLIAHILATHHVYVNSIRT